MFKSCLLVIAVDRNFCEPDLVETMFKLLLVLWTWLQNDYVDKVLVMSLKSFISFSELSEPLKIKVELLEVKIQTFRQWVLNSQLTNHIYQWCITSRQWKDDKVQNRDIQWLHKIDHGPTKTKEKRNFLHWLQAVLW